HVHRLRTRKQCATCGSWFEEMRRALTNHRIYGRTRENDPCDPHDAPRIDHREEGSENRAALHDSSHYDGFGGIHVCQTRSKILD
ncbi:hypothetical protein PFISCL1PPCAC_9863, partial [Pristionchus fissidentatus]